MLVKELHMILQIVKLGKSRQEFHSKDNTGRGSITSVLHFAPYHYDEMHKGSSKTGTERK